MQSTQVELFSKTRTLKIVNDLKQNQEDFEWYPTTPEMVDVVFNDLDAILKTHQFNNSYYTNIRLMDIGAGDGRVLTLLKNKLKTIIPDRQDVELFAIEKATIHINSYRDKGITLLGTDFNETNFVSKSTNIAFVNPPFMEFIPWLTTLLKQLTFGVFYAIVPKRWAENSEIREAIEARKIIDTTVLAEMNFSDADRQARGTVQIVRFSFNDFGADVETYKDVKDHYGHNYTPNIGTHSTNPFQLFIENELGLIKSYSETTHKFSEYKEQERIKEELENEDSPCFAVVQSRGVLWALLENYEQDIAHILTQYKTISNLDTALLQELGVKYEDLRKGLEDKLFGTRNVYWSSLFDHLDTLTDRLIRTHKTTLLNTLKANALDFTYSNAIYVISYAVEIANELIEDSIVDVYKAMTCEDSIKRYYVSNQHMFSDNWRHNAANEEAKKKAKYQLDYRFVLSRSSNFSSGSRPSLNDDAEGFMNDLMVIFRLLGYSNIELDKPFSLVDIGGTISITGTDINQKPLTLVQVRMFKNGNRHIKFDQGAMLRFNVVASRLLGWVRSRQDFEQENEMTKPLNNDVWNVAEGMKVLPSFVLALTAPKAA